MFGLAHTTQGSYNRTHACTRMMPGVQSRNDDHPHPMSGLKSSNHSDAGVEGASRKRPFTATLEGLAPGFKLPETGIRPNGPEHNRWIARRADGPRTSISPPLLSLRHCAIEACDATAPTPSTTTLLKLHHRSSARPPQATYVLGTENRVVGTPSRVLHYNHKRPGSVCGNVRRGDRRIRRTDLRPLQLSCCNYETRSRQRRMGHVRFVVRPHTRATLMPGIQLNVTLCTILHRVKVAAVGCTLIIAYPVHMLYTLTIIHACSYGTTAPCVRVRIYCTNPPHVHSVSRA